MILWEFFGKILFSKKFFKKNYDFFQDLLGLYNFKDKPEIYRTSFLKNAPSTSKNILKKTKMSGIDKNEKKKPLYFEK